MLRDQFHFLLDWTHFVDWIWSSEIASSEKLRRLGVGEGFGLLIYDLKFGEAFERMLLP